MIHFNGFVPQEPIAARQEGHVREMSAQDIDACLEMHQQMVEITLQQQAKVILAALGTCPAEGFRDLQCAGARR